LTNKEEILHSGSYIDGLDPHNSDTDDDGLPDGWEVSHGSDPYYDSSSTLVNGKDYTYSELYQGKLDTSIGTDKIYLNEGDKKEITFIIKTVSEFDGEVYIDYGDDSNITVVTSAGLNKIVKKHSYHSSLIRKPSVTFIYGNNKKIEKTLSFIIVYNKIPTVDFSATPTKGEVTLKTTFTCSASDSDGIIKKQWIDFGDGTKADVNGSDIVHNYTKDGNYTATCYATDDSNATVTKIVSIEATPYINRIPTVYFSATPTKGEVTLKTTFTCSASDSDGIIKKQWIDFGDGTKADVNGSDIVHNYTKDGNYTATCYATDDSNATVTKIVSIEATPYINRIPTVYFSATPTKGEVTLKTTFTCSASDSDGIIKKQWIDFGDGTKADVNGSDIVHNYTKDGNYTATCYATDDSNATVTKIVSIEATPYINRIPTVYFSATPTKGEVTLKTTFTCSASDSDGIIKKQWIDFGDGTKADINGSDIVHNYTKDGNYTATCYATDDSNATVSKSVNIEAMPYVNKAPKITYSATMDTNNSLLVNLQCSATDIDGEVKKIGLDFGDGNTTEIDGDSLNLNYLYKEPNVYETTCYAIDNNGTKAKISKTVNNAYDVHLVKIDHKYGQTYKLVDNTNWNAITNYCGDVEDAHIYAWLDTKNKFNFKGGEYYKLRDSIGLNKSDISKIENATGYQYAFRDTKNESNVFFGDVEGIINVEYYCSDRDVSYSIKQSFDNNISLPYDVTFKVIGHTVSSNLDNKMRFKDSPLFKKYSIKDTLQDGDTNAETVLLSNDIFYIKHDDDSYTLCDISDLDNISNTYDICNLIPMIIFLQAVL